MAKLNKTFGDYIFARTNKVQTVLFHASKMAGVRWGKKFTDSTDLIFGRPTAGKLPKKSG